MTEKHLSDKEIQDYCLNNNPVLEIESHIQHCKDCSLKIAEYKALFTSIKQQPFVAFDFNLSEIVITQLQVKKEKHPFDTYFFLVISLVIVISIAVFIYSLKKYLPDMQIHLTTFSYYIIIIPLLMILIFLCADSYNKFKTKMNILNFS